MLPLFQGTTGRINIDCPQGRLQISNYCAITQTDTYQSVPELIAGPVTRQIVFPPLINDTPFSNAALAASIERL